MRRLDSGIMAVSDSLLWLKLKDRSYSQVVF